jgi:hypothetical protein
MARYLEPLTYCQSEKQKAFLQFLSDCLYPTPLLEMLEAQAYMSTL